jgi:diaminohydroxyphosphoribosylaminopyrimidine deaminase/5-amino-6-(5-phosphoribosylamino)uracil reductase
VISEVNEDRYIQRAVELAARGLGHTRPNPAVGAVIVKNGAIIGEGWHKKAGGDHAEVAAIKNARKRNGSESSLLSGATIYVTLEQCSKVGRVGACTDAIAAAGISRVVYVISDPNPANRGKARSVLKKRGIVCEQYKGNKTLIKECEDLIKCFRKHVLTGLPYVTVKIAMSLDGRICDNTGSANWISNSSSRRLTNRMRGKVDAIMVGAETVRKDDPSLLARVRPNKDLVRVVVSKSGRLPKCAQIFTDGKNATYVFDDAEKAVVELGKMGFTSVLCEGGLNLACSLAEGGLVDEWLTVLAPVVIGNRPISKAIRASTIQDKCVFVDGDMFIRTRLV